MALIEEFNSQGSFLFRWRTYVPGAILLLSIFYLPSYRYPLEGYTSHLQYAAFCFFISLLGLLVRVLTIGCTPGRTSGRNTKEQIADVVNQTGIYSTVRHPLYLGNFLMYLGVVLFLQDLSFTLIFILFFYWYYERIMFTEEFFLRGKFGEEYLSWANKTPPFVPSLKNYKSPSLPFSFRNVLKREYPGLFGLIVIFTGLDIGMLYFNKPGVFDSGFFTGLESFQIWFFASGTVFYLFTRILVKFTKLLDVEGR